MASFLFNVEKLASELGLEHLPKDKQVTALGELEEIISCRVHVAVLERLPEDGHSYFISLIEQGREDDALAYVKEQIADLTDLIKKTAAATIDEFLSLKEVHA